jgi:hypothetical protein
MAKSESNKAAANLMEWIRREETWAAAEIVSRLDALKYLRRVDHTPPSWDWLGKIDPRRDAGGEGLSIQTHDAATGGQVFGFLKLEDGALQLSTNSVARMKRGSEMLHAALGELIGAGAGECR